MADALNSTPLFSSHQSAGAALIDFAGWHMPLRYQSQQAEHLAVRQHAGVFDVSHMLAVDITGTDARRLARLVLSNDIDRVVTPGGALYGCMLNPQGGVVDDTIWWVDNAQHLLVVLNAANREGDLAWLQKHAEGMDVAIVPRYNHGIIAVQGPAALELVSKALPQYSGDQLSPMHARFSGDAVISRTGYTGEDGLELILPASELEPAWNALLAQGITPCGLGARDSLRLEAGMMLYGNELSPQITPLEAGIGWCVNHSDPKRNFIGKEALQQQQNKLHRHLLGLLLGKGMLRAGYRVCTPDGKLVGNITSGSFSPFLNASIAMALLDAGVGDTLAVDIRSTLHQVRVVMLPFVRRGKILISTQTN